MTTQQRHFSGLDQALIQLDSFMRRLAHEPKAVRANPAKSTPEAELSHAETKHAAGLMRVNHVGEVCAQALYLGQAAVAKEPHLQQHLMQAAKEEADHLAWCKDRLNELNDRPSLLNPLWFAGAYSIGVAAGLAGDGWNLGFVVETERQVEAHLDSHLVELPAQDQKSRKIVEQMKTDEMAHADAAMAMGAKELPVPVKQMMKLSAKLMTKLAYKV